MADPKGPETGQGAKGGGARPRPPTLDLSATDVTGKAEAKTGAKPEPKPEPKPDAALRAATTAPAPEPAKPGPAAPAKPAPAASDQPKADRAAAQPKTAEAPKTIEPAKASEAPKTVEAPKPSETPKAAEPAKAVGTPESPKPAGVSKPAETPKTAEPPKPADAPKPAEAAKAAEPAKPADESAKPVERLQPAAAAAAKSAAPVPPAAAPSPPREGVGALGVAAAALGGAAIAVLVIALFGRELMGLGAGGDAARVSAAEAKLDAVGRDVAALRGELGKTAQSGDAGAVDARLAEISKTIEAANGRAAGLEGELKALAAKIAEPAPPDRALAALAGRIEGFELRLGAAPTADALASLAARIEGVEARLGELPTRQAVQDVSRDVAAMGARIEQAAGPLQRRVDEVAAALKERPKGDPAARLVVALGALDGALAAGRPFAAELGAVKAAAGAGGGLQGLDAHAAKGLPTREALGAELAAILGKLEPVKASSGGSMFERLVANAGGVVKITPKDAASGAGPAAARAKVAAAGAAGDIEGALAARGGLDEAARAATDPWAATATALVSAEDALRAARIAALARLTAND